MKEWREGDVNAQDGCYGMLQDGSNGHWIVVDLQQLADYRGTEQTYHIDLKILQLERSCLEVEAAITATLL